MCEECKRRARGEHAALELRSYPFARYARRPLNALVRAYCHFLVEPANQKKHKCCILCVTTAHRENFALAEDVYIPYFVSHVNRTTVSIHRNTFKDLMNEPIRPDLVTWGQSELYEAIIRFGSYCYCGF
ncbi:hypothetical protein B5X24_HaOG214696 [Helicoverpa armigera]|nr:hypothetical protein B5X24_HaOG214696 [Helicoverpa armigera]